MYNGKNGWRRVKKEVVMLGVIAGIWVTPMLVSAGQTDINKKLNEKSIGNENIELSTLTVFVTPRLSINNDSACCSTTVSGSGISKISVTMKLQKKNSSRWKTIKTWTASRESTSLTLSKSASVSKGIVAQLSRQKSKIFIMN